MPNRAKRVCSYPGCTALVITGRCDKHKTTQSAKQYDKERGTAAERGYNSRWRKYSHWFLKQPGNQLCALRLDDGCTYAAECPDHIDPPDGPDDPRFWDPNNHQPACIHCNSVKGRRKIVGTHGLKE